MLPVMCKSDLINYMLYYFLFCYNYYYIITIIVITSYSKYYLVLNIIFKLSPYFQTFSLFSFCLVIYYYLS